MEIDSQLPLAHQKVTRFNFRNDHSSIDRAPYHTSFLNRESLLNYVQSYQNSNLSERAIPVRNLSTTIGSLLV
jgi:hypothetical protein